MIRNYFVKLEQYIGEFATSEDKVDTLLQILSKNAFGHKLSLLKIASMNASKCPHSAQVGISALREHAMRKLWSTTSDNV